MREIVLEDIERVLPLVAAVPRELRCIAMIKRCNRRCAIGWVFEFLGELSKPEYRSLDKIYAMNLSVTQISEAALMKLNQMVLDWDHHGIWPKSEMMTPPADVQGQASVTEPLSIGLSTDPVATAEL